MHFFGRANVRYAHASGNRTLPHQTGNCLNCDLFDYYDSYEYHLQIVIINGRNMLRPYNFCIIQCRIDELFHWIVFLFHTQRIASLRQSYPTPELPNCRIAELAHCLIAALTFVARRNALRLYHNSIHHLNCRISSPCSLCLCVYFLIVPLPNYHIGKLSHFLP